MGSPIYGAIWGSLIEIWLLKIDLHSRSEKLTPKMY